MSKIESLTDQARGIDIDTAEVVSIEDTRTVQTRFGNEAEVTQAVIKDNTGEVPLTLWNDDIKKLHVGDSIKIENGFTNSYRGVVKLNVGRYGTLTVLSSPEMDSIVDSIAEDEGR